ncbi:MAG: DUF2752 domain-containing protein [Terrimicrobiaceae bacterium]
MNRLSPEGRWLRLGLAAGVPLVLLGLGLLRPDGAFLPCGFHAMSGLPCPLCGGTRAARAVLHGDLQAAAYLNPLAFPVLALFALAFVVLLAEAARGSPLAPWERLVRRLNVIAPLLMLPVIGWWIFHIVDALRTPKPELVDLRNPVAAKARAVLQSAIVR